MQVEGKEDVNIVVSGVTACDALIEKAIKHKADAILVHHGYFWKGEAQPIVGIKGRRIRKLIKHDISLLAYHLPLDAHEDIGNNKKLADILGMTIKGSFYPVSGQDLALYGDIKETVAEQFVKHLDKELGRESLHIKGDDRPIKTIGWCTGGAQNAFEQAINLGVDMYISGEISENTYHLAKESGVHYIAAGHHATERYGVKALGEHLSKEFSLKVEFIDINNPV